MVKSFIELCNNNKHKDAFRYLKNSKLKCKKYSQLLDDIYRFCNLFIYNNLKPNDKIIVFVKPSYEFYCLMFAGIMYGINIIVIDSFKDLNKLNQMIKISNAKYVFVNNSTSLIAKFLFKGLKKINVSNYYKYSSNSFEPIEDLNRTVLTTFTSGTTGVPKIINRSFKDFTNQISIIKQSYTFNSHDVVVSMLPIYVLFSLFNGNTTCIIRKINNKNINMLKADILLGKISEILKIEEQILNIKEVYFGGAYIYKQEAKKILSTFPNSKVNYTYGASEGVVIGVNTINDYYQNTRFKIVDGINIEISDAVNNIGEIVISGDSVITNKKKHYTGDIGYLKDGYVHIVGRKKYSSLEDEFYNYSYDQRMRDLYNLDKAFSIYYNEKVYVFSNKHISKEGFIKVNKIPYDLKHKTKADYSKLIDKYLNK